MRGLLAPLTLHPPHVFMSLLVEKKQNKQQQQQNSTHAHSLECTYIHTHINAFFFFALQRSECFSKGYDTEMRMEKTSENIYIHIYLTSALWSFVRLIPFFILSLSLTLFLLHTLLYPTTSARKTHTPRTPPHRSRRWYTWKRHVHTNAWSYHIHTSHRTYCYISWYVSLLCSYYHSPQRNTKKKKQTNLWPY